MSDNATTKTHVGPGAQSATRPISSALSAWAGIVGPVLFTGAFLAQEAMRREEYSPMAEPVSALEAGPNGWVQQVNFVVFGVLTIVFAIGLDRALMPSKRGRIGTLLLAMSGVGLLLAAALPLREDTSGTTYDPGGHVVAGIMFFMTSALALIFLSRRMSHDPGWRDLARYTAVAGATALVCFVVMGTLVMPDDAPVHDWAGLAQRAVILLVIFPCRILLGVRMLRTVNAS